MKFGKVQTQMASDTILAHSLKLSNGRIRKGTILNASHIDTLLSNNIDEITVASLEPGDIHEDDAAQTLAEALVGNGIKIGKASTGRVNCFATSAGLLRIPRQQVLAINGVSESITASTLQENRWVEAGKMVATIKIIPYAVSNTDLNAAVEACNSVPSAQNKETGTDQEHCHKLSVHTANARTAHLLQTTMQDMATSILEKTERVTGRRLALRQVQLESSEHCPHDIEVLTERLKDLAGRISSATATHTNSWILISGASAISDRRDVIPQALEAAGGSIERCGIPVDPGNLLMLGQLKGSTVIGIPGCARSPKHNGLDLFMDRLACDLPITQEWINSLAIGGLMDEIIDRPTPRSQSKPMNVSTKSFEPNPYHRVTAVLLAGGSSKRFGRDNKLFADRSGSPLLSHALDNLVNSEVRRLIVVLGYDAQGVKQLCSEHLKKHIEDNSISVEYVVNTDFESGMGSSLKAGVSTLVNRNLMECPTDPYAALVCLADMPSIKPATINKLMESISQSRLNENSQSSSAFVPTYRGKRGNPVLLMPELFDLLLDLSGDFGARHLLQANPEAVMEVDVDDAGIFLDCDTPEQLQANKKDRQ